MAFALLVPLLGLLITIGIAVVVLSLLGRFVAAHERAAAALEIIASKAARDA